MTKKFKKPGYTAPKMEATSFKVEQGYATSGGGGGGGGRSAGTDKFTNVSINWPGA